MGYSLVDCHPGTKGLKFYPSEDASSAATWYNGSALTKQFQEPDSGRSQWMNVLYGSAQRNRGLLPKGLVLIFSFSRSLMECRGQFGLIESSGERAQPLESVKTKYLAVSPVTDNSEQLIKDVNGGSQHSNFSCKILMGEQGQMRLWFSCHGCLDQKKSVFKRVRKNWISATQPLNSTSQICIQVIRVIPLSVHRVSLARSILYGFDPPCCNIFPVAGCSDDE